MGRKSKQANNQRSNVKNPNNPAYRDAQNNRSNQLNPNHLPSKGPDHPIHRSAESPAEPGPIQNPSPNK